MCIRDSYKLQLVQETANPAPTACGPTRGTADLHVVLDGVLVIGALLVSFVVISGMSFWDGFVNMWEQIIRETLASQNIVAAMSWDE
eukprot:2829839-Pyramimonas_sp.AAC.1